MVKRGYDNIFICSLFCFFLSLTGLYPEENKKIILVSSAYEPFIGPELENEGYVTLIAREVFKRLGYSLEIDYVPWSRALETARSGKYRGLLGAYYHRDREADFIYSLPLEKVCVVIACNKSLEIVSYNSLEDLIPYKIGVVRGYVNEDTFDKAEYLKKYPANSSKDNLSLFFYGRLDMIVDTRQLIQYLIKKDYPCCIEDIIFLDPPLKSRNLHIIFNKKIPENHDLAREFNRVLQQMIDTGSLEKIKADCN